MSSGQKKHVPRRYVPKLEKQALKPGFQPSEGPVTSLGYVFKPQSEESNGSFKNSTLEVIIFAIDDFCHYSIADFPFLGDFVLRLTTLHLLLDLVAQLSCHRGALTA